jgi:hypothetical protein
MPRFRNHSEVRPKRMRNVVRHVLNSSSSLISAFLALVGFSSASTCITERLVFAGCESSKLFVALFRFTSHYHFCFHQCR